MNTNKPGPVAPSRRGFTKVIAAAVAALPFTPPLAFGGGRSAAQNSTRKEPHSQARTQSATRADCVEKRNEHDTPPPILIGQGSLVIERGGKYLPAEISTTAGRKKHAINPGKDSSGKPFKKIFPAHIKIIDGSGEMLYRNDAATACRLSLLAKNGAGDATTVNAMADPPAGTTQSFVIDTDTDKTLEPSGEVTTSKKRDVRYRLKDGGGKEFSITEVSVVEGADVLFRLALNKLKSQGDELKVMVWLEQE